MILILRVDITFCPQDDEIFVVLFAIIPLVFEAIKFVCFVLFKNKARL